MKLGKLKWNFGDDIQGYGIYQDCENSEDEQTICLLPDHSDESKSYALLIAAAPGLLAACELCKTALEDHVQYDDGESLERDGFNAAVEAIVKAMGGN